MSAEQGDGNVPKAVEENALTEGSPEEDGVIQVEDVNGDVVSLNPEEWKLVDDIEPLEGVIDEDDEEEEPAADGNTGAGPALGGGESKEDESQAPPIVVEEDHSSLTLDGHDHEPVYSVAINPKFPNIAVSGGGDDHAAIWDISTGERKFRLAGHTDSVTAVQFSNNGAYAATASYDSTIKIWKADTGECVQTLEGPDGDVEWISWHKNADVLLAGSKDGTVWMWLAPSGKFMQVFAGHEDEVTCGMFTANGKSIVTASLDRTCRVWNPKDGTCKHQFQGYQWHEAGIISMDVHRKQPIVATGALDGSVRLAQVRKGKILHALDQEGTTQAIESVAFARTHDWLASGGADGFIDIWDVATGGCRCRFNNDKETVVKLQWLPNQPLLLSASSDAAVKLWDPRSAKAVHRLTGHRDYILTMDAIVGDSSYILTGADNGIIKKFEIPNGKPAVVSASVAEGDAST